VHNASSALPHGSNESSNHGAEGTNHVANGTLSPWEEDFVRDDDDELDEISNRSSASKANQSENASGHAHGDNVSSGHQANATNHTSNGTDRFDEDFLRDGDGNVSKVANTSAPGRHANNSSSTPSSAAACATRADSRAHSYVSTIAQPGTPCVFGVDDRDEGSHCIMEDGKYGSYGWCFTSNDTSSWGSCNEHCPLFGVAKVLADKIEALERKLAAKDFASMLEAKVVGVHGAPKK